MNAMFSVAGINSGRIATHNLEKNTLYIKDKPPHLTRAGLF